MSGKNLYEQSSRKIAWLVAAFVTFTMSLLVYGLVDNIFFGNELSAYLSNHYFRYMAGFIMIPIFGIAALIMYWNWKSNEGFEEGMLEKFEQQEILSQQAGSSKPEPIQVRAQHWSEMDDAFAQLYRRFNGYIANISGSGSTLPRQAIELGSGNRPNWFFTIYVVAFANLAFILFWAFTSAYVEKKYNIDFYEAMKAARLQNPSLFYGVLLLVIGSGAIMVFRYVYSLINNVVLPAMGMGSQVLNAEPAGPVQDIYNKFVTQKIQFVVIPLRRYLYVMFLAASLVPTAIGLVMLDAPLLGVAGSVFVISLLLWLKDNGKGEAFRVSEKGWIRLMDGRKKTDFSIADCEEVIVRYASMRVKYIRLSSASAAMRGIMSNMMADLMNAPELVPSAIIFYRKGAEPVVLPLRYLSGESGESIESHEVEFMFAYWLKKFGFSFEVAPSNEDAGDWRAYKRNVL